MWKNCNVLCKRRSLINARPFGNVGGFTHQSLRHFCNTSTLMCHPGRHGYAGTAVQKGWGLGGGGGGLKRVRYRLQPKCIFQSCLPQTYRHQADSLQALRSHTYLQNIAKRCSRSRCGKVNPPPPTHSPQPPEIQPWPPIHWLCPLKYTSQTEGNVWRPHVCLSTVSTDAIQIRRKSPPGQISEGYGREKAIWARCAINVLDAANVCHLA